MTAMTKPPERAAFADEESRWEAVVRRRAKARPAFIYAVRTTGVYCRPACASRRPRRENVRFFDSPAEAERAGFRPCKRCRPDQHHSEDEHVAIVRQACRRIESGLESASLQELSAAAGMSVSRFHRLFKTVAGTTPKQFAAAVQANRVRDGLLRGESVIDAVHGAGFGSSSRFYEKSLRILGMQPAVFGAGGGGESIFFAVTQTPLGWMLVAATDAGVCSLSFGDDRESLVGELRSRFSRARVAEGNKKFRDWVGEFADGVETSRNFDELPLDVQGTLFSRRVWEALREIPAGETRTYIDVATAIGRPRAARAVASACARNPVAVAIPCHRVVRNDGGLGGYRWGIERKRALLELEAKE